MKPREREEFTLLLGISDEIYTKRSIAAQIKNPIGVQQAFGNRSDQSYKSLVGVYNV